MAKTMNAELILLHVVSEPVYYSSEEDSPLLGSNGIFETEHLQLNNVASIKKAALHFLEKTKQHLGDKTINALANGLSDAEANRGVKHMVQTVLKCKNDKTPCYY